MTSMEIKALVAGKLPPDDETELLEKLVAANPSILPTLCQLLLLQDSRSRRARDAVSRKKLATLEERLARVTTPPLHPATVIRVAPEGRVDVAAAGRRVLVRALDGVDLAELRPGDEVFLDSDSALLVARSDQQERAGVIGSVSEVVGDRVFVRGVGDEESVMLASGELARQLDPGDRVLYLRDYPCVVDRLPQRTRSTFELDDAPAVTFADIGGMGSVIDAIRSDLDLHLRHPELVERYGLELMHGFTLEGKPGVGKTMVAAAVANYLADGDSDARFLHVKPGALRGVYYGQAEARIRELFTAARNAPGLAVLFFDELDHFGARGAGIGQDIDGRVLGALLSEINGLEPAANVLCIGATNRLDRCDAALVRTGRMGARIYTIPRPDRAATAEILATHLGDDPACAGASAQELIVAATHYLHAAAGGMGVLGHVTLQSGERRDVVAADLLIGSLLAGSVQRAKHEAARRDVEAARLGVGAQPGISVEDLLAALDEAIAAEVAKIAKPHSAREVLDFDGADEIAHVEVVADGRLPRHRHLRAA